MRRAETNQAKKAGSVNILLICALLSVPFLAAGQEAARPKAEGNVDYIAARQEIQTFEDVIDGVLTQTFTNPFGLVQKTRGVYLPGYGQMFSFLVNIHRAVINTPFGKYTRSEPISPAQKKQRIADLKNKLIRLMLDHGARLRQLDQDEYVTIVAFFEDRNFPDEENQNRTIVLSAPKRDLAEYAERQGHWEEFKQRMKIIEY